MRNILKSILLCATGASIAMGADQADQYISSRVKATIQQVNKNTYAFKEDIIEGTKTLFNKFKESKKILINYDERMDDALGKVIFNKAGFNALDSASKKHQLSVGYITAFASLKTVYTDVTAIEVFNDYAKRLLTKYGINLAELNILQSGNIQRLLDRVTLEEKRVEFVPTNNIIQDNQQIANRPNAFNPPIISKNTVMGENNKNNDSIADFANDLFNDLMNK